MPKKLDFHFPSWFDGAIGISKEDNEFLTKSSGRIEDIIKATPNIKNIKKVFLQIKVPFNFLMRDIIASFKPLLDGLDNKVDVVWEAREFDVYGPDFYCIFISKNFDDGGREIEEININ